MDPAGDGWRRIDPPDGAFERTCVGNVPFRPGRFPLIWSQSLINAQVRLRKTIQQKALDSDFRIIFVCFVLAALTIKKENSTVHLKIYSYIFKKPV